MLKSALLSSVESHRERVVQHRQHLHRHPEPSFGETRTGAYVAEVLSSLAIPFTTGWCAERGAAGIVAEVRGANPGLRRMALRADMDALPIQEVERPHASTVPGWMHACGHDAHTACLLGAVEALQATRDQWSGTVQCIFQPGEEILPGGASILVKEGALKADAPQSGPGRAEGPRVDGIVGQHVYPQLEAGHVGFRSGPYMAAADELQIRIVGKGGHAALPHRAVDPIVAAAHVITALQTVVSRACDPIQPAVLTIGKIRGGHARNIIPDEVVLDGTLRTYDEAIGHSLRAAIARVAESTAAAYGAVAEVDIAIGYPPVVNAPDLTEQCRKGAVELLGAERVVDLPLRMTGEDFSFYQKEVPGCFYRLGTGGDGPGCRSGLHTADFDIDESALFTGTAMMAWLSATGH
jgi:amidohydrolase